jgi:hypothetical protein
LACSTGRFMFSTCITSSSAAAPLPKLWVRIPLELWMFVVSVVCYNVRVSSTS